MQMTMRFEKARGHYTLRATYEFDEAAREEMRRLNVGSIAVPHPNPSGNRRFVYPSAGARGGETFAPHPSEVETYTARAGLASLVRGAVQEAIDNARADLPVSEEHDRALR